MTQYSRTELKARVRDLRAEHRQLDHAAAIEVNQAEAALGYAKSKARNQGSVLLG